VVASGETRQKILLNYAKNLALMAQRLRSANLKIAVDKCAIAKSKVQFLGYILSSRGLQIDPKKVEPILKYPAPRTLWELKRH
jgi:hypothetical protein